MNKARITAGAGMGIGALLAPTTAQADDFTVRNLSDSGAGSLREAIEDANTNSGSDRVLFKSKLSGTIGLTGGQLEINDAVQILGPGPRKLAVSGNGDSPVVSINTGIGEKVGIAGLRVTGGIAPGMDAGGGIASSGADLTVTDSIINGNDAGRGGAIFAFGDLVIERSTISGNTATDQGGGVYSFAYDVTIRSSTISGNEAEFGGGLYATSNPGDLISISNSTFSGNSADNVGGLISEDADVNLISSTVTRNTASIDVGGIADVYADTTARSTIVAGNMAPTHPDFTNTLDAAFSLIGNVSGAANLVETVPGSNLVGVDPKLKPLKDNGGPTTTHAFKKSPAKNKVPKSESEKKDQRGAKRKGKGDIGAYELVKCEGVIVNRVGTAGRDKLKGTKKKDGILGLGGNDKLSGKKGRDGLCGGRGKDKLKGGPGKDKLDGGPGKDKEVQ